MTTSIGTQLRALSHRPQRRLLIELFHRNPREDTPTGSSEPVPEDEEVEILLDFRHYHLPALEAEGFIDYDRERNVVTKGANFEEIQPVIRLIDEHPDELPDDWL